jgi:hypothetical protein
MDGTTFFEQYRGDTEDAPFLDHGSGDTKRALVIERSRRTQASRNRSFAVHFILLLLYTAVSTAIILSFHEPISQQRQKGRSTKGIITCDYVKVSLISSSFWRSRDLLQTTSIQSDAG